jgi:hypothetical protein
MKYDGIDWDYHTGLITGGDALPTTPLLSWGPCLDILFPDSNDPPMPIFYTGERGLIFMGEAKLRKLKMVDRQTPATAFVRLKGIDRKVHFIEGKDPAGKCRVFGLLCAEDVLGIFWSDYPLKSHFDVETWRFVGLKDGASVKTWIEILRWDYLGKGARILVDTLKTVCNALEKEEEPPAWAEHEKGYVVFPNTESELARLQAIEQYEV